MPRGVWPRPTAAAQSRLRVVSINTGSSEEIEQRTPAASIRGSGCSASEGTTPSSTLPVGVTSQTMPRAAISREQRGVLDRAHAVPQAIGVQHVESAAHGGRPGDLAGVRRGPEPALAGQSERPREQLGRVPVLATPQADAHDAALAVLHRPAHQLLGDLHGEITA